MAEPGAPADTAGGEQPFDRDPRRLVGRVLSGRYRIDALIGEGGMGAVYRAEHIHMRKRLAIKVLQPKMAGSEEAAARFEREAIAGAHIEHPNVAAAVDFGVLEDGSHFLVLEYLEGEDLRTLASRGPVAEGKALAIARQIALALRAAHQLGIVHRDLKPENVMLVRRDGDPGVVKVLDFGIAKVPVQALAGVTAGRAAVLTKLGTACGTPQYMSPEQAFGEEVDARSDLYALGVVLYEMLAGERPFDDPDRAALLTKVTAERPAPLSTKAAVLPGVEALVMRLLEKRAADRFGSADEVVTAIDVLRFADASPGRASSIPYEGTPPAYASWLPRSSASPPERLSASLPERRSAAFEPVPPVSLQGSLRGSSAPSRAPAPSAGTLLERLLAVTPPALRAVPPAATFSFAGLASVIAIVAVAALVRNPASVDALEQTGADAGMVLSPAVPPQESSTAPAQKPPPTLSLANELDAAKVGGLVALGPLAERFPSDPAVLKALMLSHAGGHGYLAAVEVGRRLFTIDPRSLDDEEVQQVIVTAANGPGDAAAAALDVLSTGMGSTGLDLLYELAAGGATGKYAKDHAAALLLDPAVRERASPALLIANDLRTNAPCARRAFFNRARDEGDARSLHYLRPLLPATGCGFLRRGDCFACLTPTDRTELRDIIAAIEKRRGTLPVRAGTSAPP